MTDRASLERRLNKAKRVLDALEEKASGFSRSHLPVELKIDLEDQRKDVVDLEAELAQIVAEEETQRETEAEESRLSPMRSRPLPDRYYIQRREAKKLLDRFARAIAQPDEVHPLLFNICGIGGVGKTTLLGRLRDAHKAEVDFLAVCFAKTANVETPLKLMRYLHRQAIASWGNEGEDSFGQQQKQFEDALYQLTYFAPDGEKSDREDERKIRNWFEQTIWLSPIGLTATPRKRKSVEFGEGGFSIGEDWESVQEWIQQRVRNHPATQDNSELQALMLQPVHKLTQAFAESLMQISERRGRSLVLVLDTYEKAQSYLNRWLWQYLVEDTPLASSRVRLVVVGRRSLRSDEGWRKIDQDRRLLYEISLERFSKDKTKEYLAEIDIQKGSTIAKIHKVTQGLPYYLDWVRKQREDGKELDFSQGNQAIADLLLQGIDSRQRKILQVVACCRWFNLAMIQYLLDNESLGLKYDADETEGIFEWLTRSDFVEFSERVYRLDDVARDVFRQSYFQDNRKLFQKTNALLADYFKEQAEYLYDSQSLLPDPYEDEEWREFIAESLYYGLFGKRKEGLLQYVEQIFIATYLREPDIFGIPFSLICSEINEENKDLLPKTIRKFLQDVSIILVFGWYFLDELPESYRSKLSFENENISPEEVEEVFVKQIESEIRSLLEYVSDLEDGFGKYAGLLFRSLRFHRERKNLILQAQIQIEQVQILNCCRSKFSLSIFLYLGDLLFDTESYENSLTCYKKALDLEEDNTSAFLGQGKALFHLKRYQDALRIINKAVELDPKLSDVWEYRGNTLSKIERYEEALKSYQKAIEINPKSITAWGNKGNLLSKMERYEEALESYQKVIEINPKSIAAWDYRRNTLKSMERYEEALESCQKAIELDPKYVYAWNNKGNLLSKMERYEEALESYQKAIELDPKYVYIWINRGDTLRSLRRYEESLAVCDRAYKIDSKNSDVLNTKALTLSLLKDFEKAIKAIDKAIELDSQEVLYKANRGIILARAGRYTEALADCEQAIEQNSKHESVYYSKACYHALQGEIEPTIDNLQKAIDIKPRLSRTEARQNPDFDSIRDDKRFRALVYPESTHNIKSDE